MSTTYLDIEVKKGGFRQIEQYMQRHKGMVKTGKGKIEELRAN